MDYICEQCGEGATLCVSDWGYVATLCDDCLRNRQNYLKLSGIGTTDPAAQPSDTHSATPI